MQCTIHLLGQGPKLYGYDILASSRVEEHAKNFGPLQFEELDLFYFLTFNKLKT
jgi:hypothetical protein